MTDSQLHAFARSLQILCARFPGIRFATIYWVHYLAAAAGNIASRDWIAEQDLPEAGDDYFSYYCGRRTNKDSASNAANWYHLMHQDDGTQETALSSRGCD